MWQEVDHKLYRKLTFKDFKEAFNFMSKVAVASESMNHHPTIQNTYNVVELWLSTHSDGDVVTDKDRKLAGQIDEIYDQRQSNESR